MCGVVGLRDVRLVLVTTEAAFSYSKPSYLSVVDIHTREPKLTCFLVLLATILDQIYQDGRLFCMCVSVVGA